VCSTLNVYDLKCVKETDAVPSHLLLTSIDLGNYYETVCRIAMNESRIVCLNCFGMNVIDLSLIHRLRCPDRDTSGHSSLYVGETGDNVLTFKSVKTLDFKNRSSADTQYIALNFTEHIA
jgi:hypothetical protein